MTYKNENPDAVGAATGAKVKTLSVFSVSYTRAGIQSQETSYADWPVHTPFKLSKIIVENRVVCDV